MSRKQKILGRTMVAVFKPDTSSKVLVLFKCAFLGWLISYCSVHLAQVRHRTIPASPSEIQSLLNTKAVVWVSMCEEYLGIRDPGVASFSLSRIGL